MKTALLTLLILVRISVASTYAATITWAGVSGSNWNNTSNWSPAVVPTAADDVIFNTSVLVNIDLIPATNPFIYLINSLRITGNVTVTISRIQTGGGIRILQVKSTSAITPGLKIDNGSTLIMNAGNDAGTLTFQLDLTGAVGVKGEIFGKLYFSGTGAGSGDAGLNLYTSATGYASLAVKNTGVIKYLINSGNTSSSPGPYLLMESGSTYEINKNGGSLPHGSWDANSNVLITGATTNGNVFFNQNQYGNLKWDTPLMSAATQLISNLSPVTAISLNHFVVTNTNGKELRLKTGASVSIYDYSVAGNLTVDPAGILAITGNTVTTAGGGARLHVMGSITNNGVLKADGAVGTINDIELNGTLNQDISSTGTLTGAELKFIMNNAAGATLLTPLVLPGTTTTSLQLLNGKVKTSSAAILTMSDNANYTGGSANSFIEGPMKKIGDDDTFVFPVGKGGIYAPVIFYSTGMAVTDAFQAEYFRLNPQTLYGTFYENPPIDHISYVEYWQLLKTAGSTAIPVNVTLTVTPYSFAKDITSLYVARYNTGNFQWKNSGIALRSTGPASPPYVTGSVTSAPVTQSGIFTLASNVPELINPLPVNLISFEAKKINTSLAALHWQLANANSNGFTFELQHAINGGAFTSFGLTTGNDSTTLFNATDERLQSGITLYRIKIIASDGSVSYSRNVPVSNGSMGFFKASIFPNPSHDHVQLTINSIRDLKINLSIFDIGGKKLLQWDEQISAGMTNIPLATAKLPPGIYVVTVFSVDQSSAFRLIKQ